MARFSPKEAPREFLTVVLGVIALACMIFLIFSQLGSLRETKKAVSAEKLAIVNAERQLQLLQELREMGPAFTQRLAYVENLVPAQPAEGDIIAYLEKLAQRAGTRLVQLRFERRVAAGGYTEMPLLLTFEGRFHEVMDLLTALKTGRRAVRLDAVKLGQGRDELPNIRVDIAACAFYRQAN